MLVTWLNIWVVAPTRGPEAVRKKLVEAAVELFARERDPSARAVAKRAGVNHGLIHHYLGGKAGLRRAVLDRVVEAIYEGFEGEDEASLAEVSKAAMARTRRDPRFVRILARVLLDDQGAGEAGEAGEGRTGSIAGLQTSFPVVERLRVAGAGLGDPHDVDEAVARGLTLALGSVIFGPWIRAALAMEAERYDAVIDRALVEVHTGSGREA